MSCGPDMDIDVLITGGFFVDDGSVFFLDIKYSRTGVSLDDPLSNDFGGGTPSFQNKEGTLISAIDGFEIVERGYGVTINGFVTPENGPLLTAHVDLSQDLGTQSCWTGEFIGVDYVMHFSPNQKDSITIRNQFYVKAPTFDYEKNHLYLSDTSYSEIKSGAQNRFDFPIDDCSAIGIPAIIEISEFALPKRYLLSDGSLVSEKTPFDPDIVIAPGGILDASTITIP